MAVLARVQHDCILYYCVAESLDPSVEAVRARGTFIGVPAGSKLSEAVAAVKAAARGSEVFGLCSINDGELAWTEMTSEAFERVCKRGDRFYFKVLPGSVPAVPPWEGSRAVDELLKYYGDAAAAMRSKKTHYRKELDLHRDDLGMDNFQMLGRERAYEAMLKGMGSMFRRFLRPPANYLDFQRDGDSFFAMVAYPGAGKSTLGRRCREFLSECWNSWPDSRKQALTRLDDADYRLFSSMAASSLKYDLCMFHTVVHEDGGVVMAERGLQAEQILALRCLYSILYDENSEAVGIGYEAFLSVLEKNCPGLKLRLKSSHVLIFLRRALGVDSDTWLLLSFFFDELNAITKTMGGQPSGPREPSWFTGVLSKFVGASHQLALSKARTLPVITLASTRYSAGDLKFTESAKAKARIIPLQPLTFDESRRVVLDFANRVAESLEQPHVEKLGDWVEDFLLTVAGGMPRILGLGLGSICLPGTPQYAEVLLTCLTVDNLSYDHVERVLRRWTRMVSAKYSFRYWDDQKLLIRALAASLLGVKVKRDQVIHPDFPEVEAYLWGSLEDAGLVSLTGGGSTVDLGSLPVPVRCSPFLVKQLVLLLKARLKLYWPDVCSRDPKEKEKADVRAMLLRAYLKDVSYGEQQFKLKDVLPSGSLIPYRFQKLVFRLVQRKYSLDTDAVKQEAVRDVGELRKRARCSPALLGSGNLGGDSFVFCEIVSPEKWAGRNVIFIFESKQTVTDVPELVSKLLTKFKSNVGILFALPTLSEAADGEDLITMMETGIGTKSYNTRRQVKAMDEEQEVDNLAIEELEEDEEEDDDLEEDEREDEDDPGEYVYIFNTNRPIKGEFKTKVAWFQDRHSYFSRTVFCFEQESMEHGDAISVLSLVRKLRG